MSHDALPASDASAVQSELPDEVAGRSPGVGRRHFLPLDGLRGIAVLAVLLVHCLRPSGSRLAAAINAVSSAGWLGVTLFFVRSGFLISGILLDSRGRPGYYSAFYARRALRILPLYYAFLLAMTFALPWLGLPSIGVNHGVQEVRWYHARFLANYFGLDKVGPLSPLWSLSVEKHVYLVWPALIALLPPAALRWLLLALVPLAALLRAGLLFTRGVQAAEFWTPCSLDAFALGALAASLVRDRLAVAEVRRLAGNLAIGSGSFALGMTLTLYHFEYWRHPPLLFLGQSAATLFFAAVIVLSVTAPQGDRANRVLASPVLIWFGKYSYSMYLFHYVIYRVVGRWLAAHFAPSFATEALGPTLILFAATLALTATASWLSWQLLEAPCLKWKRFFPSPGAVRAVRREVEAEAEPGAAEALAVA